MFQELVKAGLVKQKRYPNGLSVFKYARKVFYDALWNQNPLLLEARGMVLGRDLNTPSKFLVCWAETDKHGIPKGGTRTAWVLADREGVECFNLINDEHKERIEKWLSSM